jgi:hypothetical protein
MNEFFVIEPVVWPRADWQGYNQELQIYRLTINGFELALFASRHRNRGTTILLGGDTAIATVLKWKHALVAPNVMRSEDRQIRIGR